MSACDGEFGELRAYLLSKLMQNPYLDYDACMNEFLQAYYGNGWQNIRQFIDMTIQKPVPDGGHLGIYVSMADTLGFDEEDIRKADSLWENAKKEAKTETHLKNIQRSEICWRYWKGFNAFDKAETQKLIADIKALGITKISEGDTVGPDALKFVDTKAEDFGNDILLPASYAFYGVAVALSLAAVILALKKKPRNYLYILLLLFVCASVEIFGWHKRALGNDETGVIVTCVYAVVLLAFMGALLPVGKKQKILGAVLCPVICAGLYLGATFLVNELIFNGGAEAPGLGVAYILIGIEAIAIMALTARKMIKKR